LFSNYLAALNQALTFVIFEAIAHILIYLLMVFVFGHWGLKGFFYAYVSGHLILLVLVAIYFKFAIIKNKA
jgi:Na+-driven multidrug efflux pump